MARGFPVNIDFEDVPLPQFFERSAVEYGDVNALIFMNCRLTYGQRKEEVDRFATALAALGVGKDTKVTSVRASALLPDIYALAKRKISLGSEIGP